MATNSQAETSKRLMNINCLSKAQGCPSPMSNSKLSIQWPIKETSCMLLLLWGISCLIPPLTWPLAVNSKTYQQPRSLITNGAFVVTQDNKIIMEHHSKKLLIPASIIKLLTSLAALDILGPQYRFSTNFYLDKKNNLYIRGEGDPFLVTESIIKIAMELKQRGIGAIQSIILDDTAFELTGPADGITHSTNPYDAVNGALVVNFNSLPILVHDNGTIQSAETQTPLLPIMREAGSQLPKGRHRINVSALAMQGRLSLPHRYVGELFSAIFSQQGIKVTGNIQHGAVDHRCRLVLSYQSEKNLTDLIQANLEFSNNFIANQLFLACGQKTKGFPATWEKSRDTLHRFIKNKLLLTSEDLVIVEGSGLSRDNRISAAAMIHILNHFKPYHHLLPLRNNTPLKSGTLFNVFCYAGYFKAGTQYDPFVILLNQKDNNRDQLLQILQRSHAAIKKP